MFIAAPDRKHFHAINQNQCRSLSRWRRCARWFCFPSGKPNISALAVRWINLFFRERVSKLFCHARCRAIRAVQLREVRAERITHIPMRTNRRMYDDLLLRYAPERFAVVRSVDDKLPLWLAARVMEVACTRPVLPGLIISGSFPCRRRSFSSPDHDTQNTLATDIQPPVLPVPFRR